MPAPETHALCWKKKHKQSQMEDPGHVNISNSFEGFPSCLSFLLIFGHGSVSSSYTGELEGWFVILFYLGYFGHGTDLTIR